jgi:hypothetical protein
VSARLPRILSALGGLALLGSMACFPLPTIVLPGSGPKPTPQPVPTPPTSPVGVVPSISSGVYPTPGREYTVEDHKANATRVYSIKAVDGDVVTYSLTTTTAGSSPSTVLDQKVTQVNGVFWTEGGASPVTKDIESYPKETVTVKAGTYPCFKVASGANTFWFIGGICVKGSGADVDFELSKLQ